jgi:hypothetical protein
VVAPYEAALPEEVVLLELEVSLLAAVQLAQSSIDD